eukprot:1097404-Amphidinium_carterae.1
MQLLDSWFYFFFLSVCPRTSSCSKTGFGSLVRCVGVEVVACSIPSPAHTFDSSKKLRFKFNCQRFNFRVCAQLPSTWGSAIKALKYGVQNACAPKAHLKDYCGHQVTPMQTQRVEGLDQTTDAVVCTTKALAQSLIIF